MIKSIFYFLLPCFVVLLLFRIGGAVQVHQDARIAASREVCRLINTPVPTGANECTVVADLKRTFIRENYLLRFADGAVIEVSRKAIHGYSYQSGYYSLSW